MTVSRVNQLPVSLSSNTIYVVSAASQQFSESVSIPKCVAIVSPMDE
ncbi:hypothetical protein J5751_02135 [bacterium]|nr:hypothetical protein [bacterium]